MAGIHHEDVACAGCHDGIMTATAKILERAERAVVTALGRAPTGIQHLMAGHAPTADGVPIEPEVGAALRLLSLVPGSSFEDLPLEQARAQIDAEAAVFGGPPIPMAEVREVQIPTEQGSVAARLYRADSRDADRLLIYFHGGWAVGQPGHARPDVRRSRATASRDSEMFTAR